MLCLWTCGCDLFPEWTGAAHFRHKESQAVSGHKMEGKGDVRERQGGRKKKKGGGGDRREKERKRERGERH